jgi:cysteinyl-tRNA synthetase
MSEELDMAFKTMREDVQAALEDDLNTPLALTALGKLMNYMSTIPIPGVEGKYTDGTLAFIENAFGIPVSSRPDITDEQKDLIAQREKARADKDWAKSDEVRDILESQGLGLRDKPFGAQWFRL